MFLPATDDDALGIVTLMNRAYRGTRLAGVRRNLIFLAIASKRMFCAQTWLRSLRLRS